jgi:hypothetical protein
MALPTDNIRGWDDIAENYKDDILNVTGGNTGIYYTSASTTVLSTGYNFCDIDLDGDNGDLADVLEMLKHLDTEDQDINPSSSNWDHFIEVLSYYDPESTQGTLSKTSNNGPCMSLRRIRNEFNSGATGSISFSDFYRGGSYVTDNNTGIPTSGAIDFNDFYGTYKEFSFTISTDTQEANLSTLATAAGWNGSDPVNATISSGVYLWSDDTAVGGLTIPSSMNGLVTITNNGYIIGRGGDSGGNDGGPALVNNATGVTLTNASGAYIAGGGGGGGNTAGGGGAGGGDSLSVYGNRYGGAIGQAGQVGNGGGNAYHGGSGGNFTNYSSSNYTYPIGSGGGRILSSDGANGGGRCDPGTYGYGGGAGGVGGEAGSTGCNNGTGGGGGWGAAGGKSGGAGGAAISGTAIATYTNNGTVYGTVA